MSTSRSKKHKDQVRDKRSNDPFDQLIFEKGLRIRHLLLDRGIDLLAVVLSNGAIIKSKLSDFPKLRKATEKQLNHWELISEGIGIEWPDLDEDLSLKGFINSSYKSKALHALKGGSENIFA
jgi:hypothetical protein